MKNQIKKLTLCSVVVAAAVVGLATPAFAQDTAPPPPPPAPVRRVGRTSGDIANGGLGIGGTVFVSGLAGPEVVYDFGAWHLSGLLAFRNQPEAANGDRGTTFAFGVGGWYHLHIGEASDFSIGGAFGLQTHSPPLNGNSTTGFEFEPGAQIRAFITPNVALHGGVALVFEFGDNVNGPDAVLEKQYALAAGITGDFGFTYYFR